MAAPAGQFRGPTRPVSCPSTSAQCRRACCAAAGKCQHIGFDLGASISLVVHVSIHNNEMGCTSNSPRAILLTTCPLGNRGTYEDTHHPSLAAAERDRTAH